VIIFGIYFILYSVLSLMYFIHNLGVTLPILSIDITVGRICFGIFVYWCVENQEVLVPCLKDVGETVQKIFKKIKYIQGISDGGKFDILRIIKQMTKEGKQNDLKKWERQKLQTANE